jgi:hypothetical protein
MTYSRNLKKAIVTAFRLEYETAEEEDETAQEDVVKSKYQEAAARSKYKCKKGYTKRCTCFKKRLGCGQTCDCKGFCG